MNRRVSQFLVTAMSVVGLSCFVDAAGSDETVKKDDVNTTQFINDYLKKSWAENQIIPSGRAPAHEFARRVYLDLLGRIPKPAEVSKFISEGANRTKLVDTILFKNKDYAEEFARHMANQWTVWLLTRSANDVYKQQMHLWLEEQFARNVSYKQIAIDLITATGKTNDNGAVNFILAHLGEPTPRDKRTEEGHFEMVPITSRTTKLFLGLQTQCVQCHDHPFNPEWKQQAFWGVNTFFRQVERGGNPITRQEGNRMDAAILELKDDPKVNSDGIVYYERRNGMILPTTLTFLDGRRAELSGSRSRREVLADLVVTHDNFPKAMVNRVWGLLFGRGLHEQPTVDDFGEHNKVLHPELLDRLAKDFAYSDYNVKLLFQWICSSDAYQLSSQPNDTNNKPDTDVFFSRMQLRALTPEQLLDSLWMALHGKPANADGDSKEVANRVAEWNRKLVRNFGDDEGNEITFNGTVIQALLMMNGREINSEMQRRDGTIMTSMTKHKGNYGLVINDIYMACLGRQAQSHEMSAINKVARNYGGRYDATFFSDVMWALLNSNEFILNH